MEQDQEREEQFVECLLKSRYLTLRNYLRTSMAMHHEIKGPVRDYAVGLDKFRIEVLDQYASSPAVVKWCAKVSELLDQYKLII